MQGKLALGVHGSEGRMGTIVRQCIEEDDKVHLAYACGKRGSLIELCRSSSVIIDFSSAQGAMALCKQALAFKSKLVICSTGFSREEELQLQELAKALPILKASNTTIGAEVAKQLTKMASCKLPNSFEAAVFEIHHKHKKDCPSGTALELQETIEGSKAQIASIRSGEIVGEHRVFFFGQDEELSISHKVTSRKPFALGAIQAAKWLNGAGAGRLYKLEDALAQ